MTTDQTTDRNASPALLELDDVAVHFGGVKAVDGVSFELREGLIYGILGANGSGKSTLLGAMTRLNPLTRGRLQFDGHAYENVPPHRVAHLGVSRTFQTVRLIDDRTVLDNILLGLDTADRAKRKHARARAEAVMERVGITDLARMRPSELSYGMQRRAEIARAIVGTPRLLLLDEPTAGMNTDERDEISDLLRSLKDEGYTQLLVEHDVAMMVSVCDYLFAMNFGKLIAQGLPHDVVQDQGVRESYLGRQASDA
ncbi:ATP-binding cassette domain-containing protein [Gordonia sp. HNM0687]|uniref:ATP-binding cassette domain-containing protein n=1 Tax=Gordonia mangrovi TaxID=2665643 RepID=A0A6L7GWE6_9ACTN|nr:ABC transporter ATP-binding protein [Gordonia mangrovi]MXP24240.1 ATP-binding cassette domain-containing protein [Gordonia mangrovi]UVF79939.1 ABC transporter ATP-binding protein [Gordonia mangrovi]